MTVSLTFRATAANDSPAFLAAEATVSLRRLEFLGIRGNFFFFGFGGGDCGGLDFGVASLSKWIILPERTGFRGELGPEIAKLPRDKGRLELGPGKFFIAENGPGKAIAELGPEK